MIYCPCEIDGEYFENTRLAHRTLFMRDNRVSYFKLQRALKNGKSLLLGHEIKRVKRRFPLHPDGYDHSTAVKKHKPGEPLLVYPLGERPLDRGLPARWC